MLRNVAFIQGAFARGSDNGGGPYHRQPPVGPMFVGLASVMSVLFVAALVERARGGGASESTVSQFGMVGTTVFFVAGLAAAYCAITTRNRTIAPIVAVLLGPGAIWCWMVFVNGSATGTIATTIVVLAGSAVGVLLLADGIWQARWLGLFCGLGAVGISMAATMLRNDPNLRSTASLALLVVFSGMACLYGTLVEIESRGRQSFEQLLDSKKRIEAEIAEAEELLHDLRSGLLSIEAAMSSVDDPVSGPIRLETARLRKLVASRRRKVDEFDVVASVRTLAGTRRAAGTVIDLRVPTAAKAIGEPSEIAAIIDNMLSNAVRHGASPVRIEIQEQGPSVHVAVIDSGKVAPNADVNGFFKRGFTTHQDGDGIGLDRARSLAQQNGGSVDYVPGPRGETSFVLTIPSAAGQLEAPAEPDVSWAPPAAVGQ